MKGKITQTTSGARTKGRTDFKRLRQMSDADIDFSDIPKLGKSFWKTAKLTMPKPKARLTIRIDHDVVEWLKKKRAAATRPVSTPFCAPTWRRNRMKAGIAGHKGG